MLSIGAVAKRVGCSVPTIRYYESVGLLPEAERGPGGQRLYGRRDLARLNFIRRCRDMDMPIDRISDLLILESGGRPCAETLTFFSAQRDAIKARIESLQMLEIELGAYIATCENGCAGKAQPCSIFDQVTEALNP